MPNSGWIGLILDRRKLKGVGHFQFNQMRMDDLNRIAASNHQHINKDTKRLQKFHEGTRSRIPSAPLGVENKTHPGYTRKTSDELVQTPHVPGQ
jgi:hypothetical protein